MVVSMAKIRKFGRLLGAQVIFIFLSTAAFAQSYYEENENTFYGGPVIGANFCQVDGDYYAGYYKTGLNVGGIVYTKLGKNFLASMEILYTQKGSRGHKEQLSKTVSGLQIREYGISLDYAEIPLMIHLMDKRKSHIGVGVSYSQLVSSKESVVTNRSGYNDSLDVGRFPFKSSDINVLVGFNLRLYKGLFFNVRYQYSLLPIRSNVNMDYSRSKQYNNLYVVRLAYIFGQKY
jgi:hypothetical protein